MQRCRGGDELLEGGDLGVLVDDRWAMSQQCVAKKASGVVGCIQKNAASKSRDSTC